MPIIPEGTRYVLPPEWERRESLRQSLQEHFATWGYQPIQTPALEFYDPLHPLAERAFKLIDRDGEVLALRSEYTTALGRLIRSDLSAGQLPLRLSYAGQLWLRDQISELGRMREFSQVGVELIGPSSPLADAELLEMAAGALERAGVRFQLELGHPGFVHAVLRSTGLPEAALADLHRAVDGKAQPELAALLDRWSVSGCKRADVLRLTDLYGGAEILPEARALCSTDEASSALDWLQETIGLLGPSDLLLDLGMSRRYGYYTGLTFRAHTPDLGLPLLGGGRYDAGIPGAGFAIGLERLLGALGEPPVSPGAEVLAADLASARWARSQGHRAELAHCPPAQLIDEARRRGARWLAQAGQLVPVRA